MITVYRYKGRFGDVPADYIPCLIGYGTNDSGTGDDEVYFETNDETDVEAITAHKVSLWFSGPTRIVSIRYQGKNGVATGYALADELLTAGLEL